MNSATAESAIIAHSSHSMSTWPRRLVDALQQLCNNVWFAYGSLLLLQLKVVWHIWQYRDITIGDTAGYFTSALTWVQHLQNTIAWSPLYTAFYGTLLRVVPDAYSTTLLHRLIIVFTASVLVLTLMRRLLSPAMALLVSAWWAILPVNFDTLYEVHLFAVLPALLIFIVAARRSSPWIRGLIVGLFIIAAVLVRNELSIALGLWAIICLITEIRERRTQRKPLWLYAAAYGLPSVLALGVIVFFYSRSFKQGAALEATLEAKHTLNVCQIYAFNYQQRFSDWQLSPWTQCQDLMKRDFGVPQPSMVEAIRLNPGAMANYFLWNIRLIPAGLQKLMFNRTADTANPDYAPTHTGDPQANMFSLIVLGVVLVGGIYMWRERRHWWDTRLKDHYMAWLAILCAVVSVVVVMLTERPRPSYMFNLSILLLATFGLAFEVIITHTRWSNWFAASVPLLISALIIFMPPYYTPTYDNVFGFQGRPIMTAYHRLEPFATLFQGQLFGLSPFSGDLCRFIDGAQCSGLAYNEIMNGKPESTSVSAWLEQKRIGLVYIDETYIDQPDIMNFVSSLDATHWQVIVNYSAPDGRWMLIRHIGTLL